MTIDLAGERVELRGDRTLHWPRRRTLVLADPHFGKVDAFRAAGVPVPGNCSERLACLDRALQATAAERLIILGDFWHAREGCTPRVMEALVDWRNRHDGLTIALLRGNHDRAAPPPNWDFWQNEDMIDAPFIFRHHPGESAEGYTLAGHLHPGITLHGSGRQRLRLPCFWLGRRVAVLPTFGAFTGLMSVTPDVGDRVYAIADDQIFLVPVQ